MTSESTDPIKFWKHHGAGNDFITLPWGSYSCSPNAIRALCEPHLGVGADGVMFYEMCATKDASEVVVRIFNNDGTRPEMCGNGVRCLARHLVEHCHLPSPIHMHTDAGLRVCEVHPASGEPWNVTVNMGVPDYEVGQQPIKFNNKAFSWAGVDMGNPHAVIFNDADEAFIDAIGKWLNDSHPYFSNGVNVEFTTIVGENHLRVVVFERGVGRTQACGTGACAAAVVAWEQGLCDTERPVIVDLPGGQLQIAKRDEEIWMTGPVVAVYSGELHGGWQNMVHEE